MKQLTAQRLSSCLLILSILLLVCDVLLLPLLPVFAYFRSGDPNSFTIASLQRIFAYDFDDGLGNLLHIILVDAWRKPNTATLAFFLLVCGICAAVILVQSIRILASVADSTPFSAKNSASLKCAALGCFGIAVAAAIRTTFSLLYYASIRPLFSYCALFIPLFIMAGLLCLVMSGLFCRAEEMKTENDLTI